MSFTLFCFAAATTRGSTLPRIAPVESITNTCGAATEIWPAWATKSFVLLSDPVRYQIASTLRCAAAGRQAMSANAAGSSAARPSPERPVSNCMGSLLFPTGQISTEKEPRKSYRRARRERGVDDKVMSFLSGLCVLCGKDVLSRSPGSDRDILCQALCFVHQLDEVAAPAVLARGAASQGEHALI